MIDPDAFAVLICDWSLELQPGQQVLIATTTLAEEAACALYRAVLERDAWPLLQLDPPGLEGDFFRHARERHFDGVAPAQLAEAQSIDARVRIAAPHETQPLAGVDQELLARVARARRQLQEVFSSRRWCGTIWPTPALAQQAGMSEADYTDFLNRALFLDQPNPAAAWQRLSDHQATLVQRLERAHEIRIQSHRTDLRLNVGGRRWANSDGRRNMPSGEVFTGPQEDSANGSVYFDIPSSGRGAEVRGVELTFVDGAVVRARAEEGDAILHGALAIDPGARYLGELGIGTNTGIDRPTGSTLLDEKMAGTVHLALGRSYPETGGTNESALHWDLICDLRSSGLVTIDGEPFIEDGAFVR